MVTVMRAVGLRVVIFINDHRPAHVHVFGDGEAKINLLGPDGKPALLWAETMTRSEIRRTMLLVNGAQDFLLQRWEYYHGRDN